MTVGIAEADTVNPNQVLTGTNTWYRTNIYVLNGGVFVMSNAVLNIEAGTVINIADMQPHSEQSHCAARQARYALEMNRGWFAARGIKPGMRLGGIPGR